MLKAVLESPGNIVFSEAEIPQPKDDEVLIEVERMGICGSDIHAYHGKHPFISCPVLMGHEFSGTVAKTGKNVKGFDIEERVAIMPQITCDRCYQCRSGRYNICDTLKVIGCQSDGGAQEYIAVDSSLVFKLPEKMSFDYGAMIEPAAVGVHAVRRAGDVKGLAVLVLGAGTIGNLTAQAAKALGAKNVMITDLSSQKLETAKKCGIKNTVNVSIQDLEHEIRRIFGEDKADVIFECVGIEAVIGQAVSIARKGSDIIVVGVYGKKPSVDMGLVQDKELRLTGTLMYVKEDYDTAAQLISEGEISLDPLITKHFKFNEYGRAFEFIEENKNNAMKILIDY
jgi:L-iditol 2-dehydrogenase